MSTELKPSQQSEEVDLGLLFKGIGNLFNNLFVFIANIFNGAFKLTLMLLIHFYKRKIWYAGVIVLGFVLGYVVDYKSDRVYGANMFIQTNFNSARQVYENVKNLHELAAREGDTLRLAEVLNISVSDASKLLGFYIEPDLDENDMVEMYSEFYVKLDSLSRTEVSYNQYKESLTPYNYSIHRIGVASKDKNIYKRIEQEFANHLANNPYLDDLLDVNNKNLERENLALTSQLSKNDSLANEYLRIRIKESEKEPIPGSGTNLYMGDSESTGLIVDESKIIEKALALEAKRREVYQGLVEQKNVVNVLASFPVTGYDISKWTDKKKFVLPLAMFAIMLVVFMVMGLGKYLENEGK